MIHWLAHPCFGPCKSGIKCPHLGLFRGGNSIISSKSLIVLLRRRNIVLREKKVLCNLNVKTIIRMYFLGRRGLRYLRIAIVYGLYRIVVYINVCAEIELLKVKVPLICLCTEGVSARREGR